MYDVIVVGMRRLYELRKEVQKFCRPSDCCVPALGTVMVDNVNEDIHWNGVDVIYFSHTRDHQ